MKKQPNRLEVDLVNAAFDFYARRPWNNINWDALFLVRVPTEDLPLVAAVMGSGGDEYGLLLARGENAMQLFASLVLDTPAAEEFDSVGDLLSISFNAWGTVDDEYRQLLEKAGQVPRRERVVPVIFLSPPHREPHPPGRADMRTLLLILRGINAALGEGVLQPCPLDPRARRILEVEVEQNGKQISYVTREVEWPESPIDIPPLLMLPGDLENLPTRQERWLFARLPLPARIDDDDRLAYALLLGAEDGELHGFRIARGADLSEAAQLVAEAMRGQGLLEDQAGRPSSILFNDHWLHGALTPALAGLGISTEVDPESEELDAMLDAVSEALPDAELELEPDSLEAWKAAELETSQFLSAQILRKELITPRAMQRHFGDADDGEQVLETYSHLAPHASLVEWVAADYRPTRRSKTLIEKLLSKPDELDPQTRMLLEARQAARISVYRVDSCEPGLSLEVEDIFDGERFTVHDRELSGCDLEGVFLPLRLLHAGQWMFPLFAGPPLTALQITHALDAVTLPDAELNCTVLGEEPEILSYLWSWFLHQHPPLLQNTDGDELENQSATFRVTNVNQLLAHFEQHPDLQFDEPEGSWVWWRESGSGADCRRTVLGRLTLLDDRLLLEVNSAARLERARTWLEALDGVCFESSTSSAFDSAQRPLDDRLPSPPEEAMTPEMFNALKSATFKQYLRWVDEQVPMLGNLTPRQACASAAGARKVQQMIRTMPAIQTPAGPIEVPRAEILTELGIDGPAE